MLNHTAERCETNQRKYLRLHVPGLAMRLRIVSINSKAVKTSSHHVLVLNIGPGGLQFTSSLLIPDDREVKISVQTILTGIRFETEGYIIWRKTDENMYVYGVRFDMSTLHRSFLIRLLNYVYMKQSPQHQKIHQYYAYFTQCYLEQQGANINYTT